MTPRSTVSSRNTSRGLAWRVARLGAAQICQYVTATSSTAKSAEQEQMKAADTGVHSARLFARCEMQSSRPTRAKFAVTDEPP